MSKLAWECAMVGLMRVGYGFSTGQQGNKSIDYYCNKVQVFTTWLLLGTTSVHACKLYQSRRMFSELSYMQQLDVSGPLGVSWVVFSSWHGLLGCGRWYQSGQSVQSGCMGGWCKCGRCLSVVGVNTGVCNGVTAVYWVPVSVQ